MSINSHPLKQIASVVDDEIHCGKDVAQLIASFDTNFKQLKLDLAQAIQDRVDRKLEYKNYYYLKITTIIHEKIFEIKMTTFIHCGNRYSISKKIHDLCFDKGESIVTEINGNYNGGDRLLLKYYPRKSLHKLTKEELNFM